MSTSIVQAMDSITGRLEAAGVRCVIDERDVNPPCVLIGPPTITYRFHKGSWVAAWALLAIVPDSGRRVATDNLDALVTAVQAALGGTITTAVPLSFTGVDTAPALPAYQLAFNETYC